MPLSQKLADERFQQRLGDLVQRAEEWFAMDESLQLRTVRSHEEHQQLEKDQAAHAELRKKLSNEFMVLVYKKTKRE